MYIETNTSVFLTQYLQKHYYKTGVCTDCLSYFPLLLITDGAPDRTDSTKRALFSQNTEMNQHKFKERQVLHTAVSFENLVFCEKLGH